MSSGPEQVRQFFAKCLTHHKGEMAGKPFRLSDWQYDDIINPLFNTKNPDGTRQYRTCFIEVPRKNGKSTLAAGLALYLLFADGEQGAEVVSAAADREQAAIVFDLAKQMVEASPVLSKRCTLYRRHIETRGGSTYKVISADAYSKHGMNLSGIIFDEVHAQPDRELWDVLTTATGARRQPLTFAITTAGYDRTSLCYELHTYADNIKNGLVHDPTFLPIIYAADESDDWAAEATWRKANPGYGVSIKPEYFANAVREAKILPAKEQTFRRLHLCQWTESETRWIAMDRWDASAGTVDANELQGRECFAGLDLSSTSDLTALSLVFPMDDNTYQVLPFFFAPESADGRRQRENKARLKKWQIEGNIELTPGDVIDYDRIRAKINEVANLYQIKEIAIDRWNATQLAVQLQGDGHNVILFGQGFASMSSPTKEFEALILAKRFHHGGHPILRWMAGNVVIEQDAAGNIKASKKRSSEKIDGIVATVMGLARSNMAQQTADGGFERWD